MSRQSSLVEDRISSDEDEFQEERSGTFSNGQSFRPHSYPTTKAMFHCATPRSCYTGSEDDEEYDDGSSAAASEHCSVSRVPPEPDLIREILAQKSVDSGQDGLTAMKKTRGAAPRLLAECGNVNHKIPMKAFKPRHNAVGSTRSTPELAAGPPPSSSSASTNPDCSERRRWRGRRRGLGKKFKLRSCLIQSCITH